MVLNIKDLSLWIIFQWLVNDNYKTLKESIKFTKYWPFKMILTLDYPSKACKI